MKRLLVNINISRLVLRNVIASVFALFFVLFANAYEQNENIDICLLNYFISNSQYITYENVGLDIENSKCLRPDFLDFKARKENKNILVANELQNIISFQSTNISKISGIIECLELDKAISENDFSSKNSYIKLGVVVCSGKVARVVAKTGTNLVDDTASVISKGDYLRIQNAATRINKPITVAGGIHAREVLITETAGADFVFDNNYNLRSLTEVEQFINENNHLPDIAPASDMQENGIKMGVFQIKLLQKIEELTLYVIEQQKEIDELKERLSN